MRSNGWKKSHFKEGEVRSSPRKRARKDTLASGLPLGAADDEDDDEDEEASENEDTEETATQAQPAAATGA